MKTKSIAIVLVIIGVIMTIYTGFSYVTTEKVVDLGPIQVNKEENHPVQWKPIVGILIVVVGGIMFIKGNSGKKG